MKPMTDDSHVRGLGCARDEKVSNFPVRGFSLLFQTRAILTGIHFSCTNRRSGCVWPYNSRKLCGGPVGALQQPVPATLTARPLPKAPKENIQPLTFSTVVVFFLLSTVFPEWTGTPYFKGVGGFSLCFPALFYVPSFSLIEPLGWNLLFPVLYCFPL